MTPCLNWRELHLLIEKIRPEIQGLFVDRWIVPERRHFPSGYLKGEWALRLTGRKENGILLISIRPRHPYIAWHPGKGPNAARLGTHSPFDLAAQKHLKGSKLLECIALPQERTVHFWFSNPELSSGRIGLVLTLIPAAPEALLVYDDQTEPDRKNPETKDLGYAILSRSRNTPVPRYFPPNGAKAPPDLPIRTSFLENSNSLYPVIETELLTEAFTLRTQATEKQLQHSLKQAQERLKQSQTALHEGEKEKNWQRWGELLKFSSAHEQTPFQGKVQVTDYATGQAEEIPIDPKLSIKEQIEKFFHSSRRKQKRIQEAQGRIHRFEEVIQKVKALLAQKPGCQNPTQNDWDLLSSWERKSGSTPTVDVSSPNPAKKNRTTWLGKTFVSRDQLPIWVGRSKDENLELTFKHARGNDLWMHVRGRPGAHSVVPLQPGKSAPLETLLDAAMLTVYYSGGANWGKTEVDYTFKKYVKRIKDSSEASYTNNKTLLVEPDPVRLKRLLDQSHSSEI